MGSGGASYQSAIATNRFGLGARPQDQPGAAPQSWVLGGIAAYRPRPPEIGRAHVCTPVTNAHLVCRLLLEKKKNSISADGSVMKGGDQGRQHRTHKGEGKNRKATV